MSNNVQITRRDALSQIAILAIVVTGCGGGRGDLGTQFTSGGRVTLTVSWPASETVSRYIPVYARSLVLELYKADNPDIRATLVANRPEALPTTQTLIFTQLLPIGTYILAGVARVYPDGQGATVASALTQVEVKDGARSKAALALNSTIRAIEVLNQPLKLQVGDTYSLIGQALDPDNKVLFLPSDALKWSVVSGASFGTVTVEGKFTALAAGITRVRLAETVTGVGGEADIQIGAVTNAGLANSPWPKFRGGATNAGRLGQGSGAVGTLKWKYPSGSWVGSSPTVGQLNAVYFSSSNGKLYALDTELGVKIWELNSNGQFYSSPSIGGDGTVYVANYTGGDARLFAIDGVKGTIIWEATIGSVGYSSVAVGADKTLYVGSYDGKLYAVDGVNGNVKWAFATGGLVHSSPTIDPSGMVYVGSSDGKLYAVNSVNGTKKWEFVTTGPINSSPALAVDGTLYIGCGDKRFDSSSSSKLYAVNTATGTSKWEFATGGAVASSPMLDEKGTVYVGSRQVNGGKLFALDASNGTLKWEFASDSPIDSSPAIDQQGTLYFLLGNGKLYALDTSNQTLKWEFQTIPNPNDSLLASSPTVGPDGTVYVASWDGFLYAVK